MPRQLSFDLPARAALGRDDFFVAPSNAMGVAMIDAYDNWPTPQLVLSGPAGSGKTHLAHVWSTMTGAPILAAADLPGQDIPSLASAPAVIEDVPAIATDAEALEQLFHLFNLSRAQGQPLLLTGRPAPRHWNLALADIQSRIESACHAELEPPDDQLLAVVLAKLFNDRQVMPKPDVIPYLLRHMERSFEAADRTVRELDRLSLSEGRQITRALAARIAGIQT